jgi:hypothetical protein
MLWEDNREEKRDNKDIIIKYEAEEGENKMVKRTSSLSRSAHINFITFICTSTYHQK